MCVWPKIHVWQVGSDGSDGFTFLPIYSPMILQFNWVNPICEHWHFIHPFKEAPVVPLHFLLHKTNFQICHDELFSVSTRWHSFFGNQKKTNKHEEQAFIKKNLPLAPHLRCWNHIFWDTMRWCSSHGTPMHDISVYLSDTSMRELFHLLTEAAYVWQLDQFACKWSAPFHQYHLQNVHSDTELIAFGCWTCTMKPAPPKWVQEVARMSIGQTADAPVKVLNLSKMYAVVETRNLAECAHKVNESMLIPM